MYDIKEITNKIVYGDNLTQMRLIPPKSIDLIYLDPQFYSQKDYEIIFGDEDKFPGFFDIWKGKDGDETRVGGIGVYEEFMKERLVEMYRILKPTGTIFLHCDKHANHHLRKLLDDIFGAKNFLNEIIWYYKRWTNTSNKFQQMHDNIYWYAKGKKYVFNPQYEPYSEKTVHRKMSVDGKTNLKEKRDIKKGVVMSDVWDIPYLHSQAKERRGWKTQKPEALLERIILAASNKGDIVFDPFCGCGTTIAVAKRLKRKFIGIDWSWLACKEMADRIGQNVNKIIRPINVEDIKEMDGFRIQRIMCEMMGAKSNPEEIADKGIDGWFPDGTAIQVKKSKAGNRAIKEFAQSIQLHKDTKNDIGVFVASKFSRNAEEVIVKVKKKSNIDIIPITIQEVLDGKFDNLKKKVGHIKLDGGWFWYLATIKKMKTAKKDGYIQKILDWNKEKGLPTAEVISEE